MKPTIQKVLNPPLLRFLIVGGLAFVAEYGSFYAFLQLTALPVLPANIISFIIGLMTSFTLNRLWTFGYKDYHNRASFQFTMYVVLACTNLVLTVLLVSGMEWLGIVPQLGKFIAMIITSLWNFVLYKRVIFKRQVLPVDEES